MRWATSRLVVFPRAKGAGLRFRGVRGLVISQFCVRDTEVGGRRMVGLAGEFPVKTEGADIRRILVAHAMRHESVVCNGHKVFRGCTFSSAKREGVFTHRSPAFKPKIL